jgi:hypothetical protein
VAATAAANPPAAVATVAAMAPAAAAATVSAAAPAVTHAAGAAVTSTQPGTRREFMSVLTARPWKRLCGRSPTVGRPAESS